MVFEMLFYLSGVSNVNVSLNWDWFVYVSCLVQIWRIAFGFRLLFFPSLEFKTTQKSVDYVKGKLRDNLKVISFLFVFGLWLLVCALSISSYSKPEFSCSLAAVSREGGDRKRSGEKMLNYPL